MGSDLLGWRPVDVAARGARYEHIEPLGPDIGYFEESVAHAIAFRAGTDFPPGTSHDRGWFDEFERRASGEDPQSIDRYFEFIVDAADPGAAADTAKGHGPYFHPVGRLLGHSDSDIREDLALLARGEIDRHSDYDWRREHRDLLAKEGAAWRQLLRLFSCTALDYHSPYDAAPIYIMARDDGARPWIPGGGLLGICAK